MATKKVGSAIIRASSGQKGRIVLPGATDLEAVKTFLTSIKSAYMTGVAESVAWSEMEKTGDAITEGNTDRKAIIVYADTASNTTKRISIPSWGTDTGDFVLESAGERVPLVACQSVVEALEVATGRALTAIEGYIIQKR